MSFKKKVFIIVLTWNRKDLVLECLESLYKCKSEHELQYIVVDNGSTDGTTKAVHSKFPKTTVLHTPINLGWSGGNNKGIEYALKNKADYVILLSNDLVVHKNFIDNLLAPFFSDIKIGIVGPKILDKADRTIIKSAGYKLSGRLTGISLGAGKKDGKKFSKNKIVEMVSGSAMGISVEVFKRIGLFDDKFFLYFEEADFCLRARKEGFNIMYAAKACVYHIEGATNILNSPLHIYYNIRNHLLFIEKHGNLQIFCKVFYDSVRLLISKYFHGKKDGKYIFFGILDYLFRRFGGRKYWK